MTNNKSLWILWKENAGAILSVFTIIGVIVSVGFFLFASKDEVRQLDTRVNVMRVEMEQSIKSMDNKLSEIKESLREIKEDIRNKK